MTVLQILLKLLSKRLSTFYEQFEFGEVLGAASCAIVTLFLHFPLFPGSASSVRFASLFAGALFLPRVVL